MKVKGYLVTLTCNVRTDQTSPFVLSVLQTQAKVFREVPCDEFQTYHIVKPRLSFAEQDVIEDWWEIGNASSVVPYLENEIVTLAKDNAGRSKWVILSPPQNS